MSNYFLDAPRPDPLLAVEFHYFRVPRERWEPLLSRLRQLGANAVGTALCWGHHEPQEGQIDLTGATDPQRDAAGFVDLCAALGFKVLLRVGPFIDAGTLGGGIPAWLYQQAELQARRHDGQPWRHPASDQPRCSFEHPRFLEQVRRWFEQVAAVLADRQWPAGPIAALLVDSAIPGAGMTPPGAGGAAGFEPHERADFNEHVIRVQWPIWLRQRYDGVAALNAAYGSDYRSASEVDFPPQGGGADAEAAARRQADAHRFVDWTLSHALQTYTRMLRELGWQVPLSHALGAVPWQAAGRVVDPAGMAGACDWLGHDLPAASAGQDAFEEYVHFCFWQGKLVRAYRPELPLFLPFLSAARAFDLRAPFLAGPGAVCLEHGVQVDPDPPGSGAGPRWAAGAPLRPDGSLRRPAYEARLLFTYLAAAGADYVSARPPAGVAIGYTHLADHAAGSESGLGSGLAGALVQAGLDFDVVDVDRAPAEQLARYAWVLLPATRLIERATWGKVAAFAANGGRFGLVGEALPELDERLEPLDPGPEAAQFLLAPDTDWAALLGEVARPAWSSTAGVDVTARFGAGAVYLAVANRRTSAFRGEVHVRGADGAAGRVSLKLGAGRIGMAALRDGELVAALLHGDGQGEAAAGETRFAFDGEAAVVAAAGSGLVLTASGPGRFRLARPAGWAGVRAHRLLLSGEVEAGFPVRAGRGGTLSLDYPAADDLGETDRIWLLAEGEPLPAPWRAHLASLLAARGQVLARCARVCRELAEALRDPGPARTAGAAAEIDAGALAEAERGLSEAREALQKAVASLGALEAEVAETARRAGGQIRPAHPLRPVLLDLSSLPAAARDRLRETGQACAAAAEALAAAQGPAEAEAETLTIERYLAARSETARAGGQVAHELGRALAHLRSELAAGALPPLAWPVHNWLEHIVRSLAYGLGLD